MEETVFALLQFDGLNDKMLINYKTVTHLVRLIKGVNFTIHHRSTIVEINDEPEFQQIVHNVEAKYQAEHERVRKWPAGQGML